MCSCAPLDIPSPHKIQSWPKLPLHVRVVKAMSKPLSHLLLFLITLILCGQAHGRYNIPDGGLDLVSDGVHRFGTSSSSSYLTLNRPVKAESTCDETYGFLPCTTTVLGNIFLIIVYGSLMYLAATYLSNGSELLLEILGPGIIGGLFLPILGALPDAMLILVSGLSGSTDTAQSQVSVGMGLLAGSTVMLITVVWASCVIIGKCDIENDRAINKKDTKGFSLTGSGVSTDIWTSYSAIIMAVSVIPFIIVQLPQLLSSTSARRWAVLIALIFSVALLISYCMYQVYQPWIQRRRLAYAKHKHVISGLLQHLKQRALGKFLDDDGELNKDVIERLFRTIDEDGDDYLSRSELRALIIGIRFDEIELDKDDAVEKVMKDFDTSRDSRISLPEFIDGVSKWLREAKHAGDSTSNSGSHTMKYLSDFQAQTKKEHDLLGADDDQSDEVVEGVDNPKRTSIKAGLLLLAGALIAAAFADPLVDAVDNFSDASGIPTFFISFIALPLATNSSEAVSAIIFASRKTRRTASLTFSELYGAVTMNNVLCLSVFLALVYVRGLTWDFSAEVLVIVIVCVVMGVFGSLRTAFPLWTCFIAYLLYPFSLVLVYVLDYIFGWS